MLVTSFVRCHFHSTGPWWTLPSIPARLTRERDANSANTSPSTSTRQHLFPSLFSLRRDKQHHITVSKMAENVPPTSGGDGIKGMPYYEKLKRDLRETIHKKRTIDRSMVRLLPTFSVL